MRLLSAIQPFACARPAYEATMRALLVVLLVLVLVPGWTGAVRLDLLGRDARIEARRVLLDPHDPYRTRVGALTFLGGVSLTSPDPAFGGFSSVNIHGERFTLLSDGGNAVSFRLDDRWRISEPRFANLPGGPGTGWQKEDRDSESMATDPATGRVWVGFENANAIWRYAPDFTRAERFATPPAMAKWYANLGAETLVRRRDGSFLVLSESAEPGSHGKHVGLIFRGDPTEDARAALTFAYRPPRHYDPSDAAELLDGRLVVVNRRFQPPYRFLTTLTVVERADIKPGAVVKGRVIATLAPPLIHDNFEGVAVTRKQGATILWLVSDDNQFPLQRSLLLKFRLDPGA